MGIDDNLNGRKDWEEISLGTIKWLENALTAGKDFVLDPVLLSWGMPIGRAGMITTTDQQT